DLVMTIKTVLSVLGVNHFDDDLKGAIDFCETHGAHLTAMLISMGASPPIGSYEVISTVWIEERRCWLQIVTVRLEERDLPCR
ncbi:hypothetical protein ACC764_38885, partial [Rhizobium ruizarguesonis]